MKKLLVLLTIVLFVCCAFDTKPPNKKEPPPAKPSGSQAFESIVVNLYEAAHHNPGVMQTTEWKQYTIYAMRLTYDQAVAAGYTWEADFELPLFTVGISMYRKQPNKSVFNAFLEALPHCRNLYNVRSEKQGKYRYIWAETAHYGGCQIPGGDICPGK
jgi:hypothetical protein